MPAATSSGVSTLPLSHVTSPLPLRLLPLLPSSEPPGGSGSGAKLPAAASRVWTSDCCCAAGMRYSRHSRRVIYTYACMHRPPLACGPQPVVARIALSPLCRRWERSSLPLAGWCMNVCVHESMCVFVCVRERERERESMHVCMHECMPKCVCVSPATGHCVHTMFLCDYHGIICIRQSPESASPPTMRIICKSQSPRVHPLPLCALYAKVNHLRVHPLRAGRACTRALWRKGACSTLLYIHAYKYMACLECLL